MIGGAGAVKVRQSMESVLDEYIRTHPGSARAYAEASRVLPSGVTHEARFLKPFPAYMTHGHGCHKWDVDGNEYIDYVTGHGAMMLGHSHPRIVAAVQDQAAKGTHLGGSTELEGDWAREVCRLVPSIKRLRFHSSGTEATMMAMRLARAYTGKPKILTFQHHFHGWHDYAMADSSRYATVGVPQSALSTMLSLEAGDLAAVATVLEAHDDIAGIIIEPTGAHMGALPLEAPFLHGLRELSTAHGVLLIFDEIVTGFRVTPGGAQQRLGITPDLTTLAKILAGGLPGGAVGGAEAVMDLFNFGRDGERVGHPGTFNANPLSAAAGTCCLRLLDREDYPGRAERQARALQHGLTRLLADQQLPGFCYRTSSHVWLVLGTRHDGDPEYCGMPHAQLQAARARHPAADLRVALLNEGLDLMAGNQFLLSGVHQDHDVQRTLEAVARGLARMAREDLIPPAVAGL